MFKEGDWVVVTKPDPEFGDYNDIKGVVLKLIDVKDFRLYANLIRPGRNYSTKLYMYEREVEPASDVQILAAKLKG